MELFHAGQAGHSKTAPSAGPRALQVNRNKFDAAVCTGSCALYRRSALDHFGGTAMTGYSEDLHTGFNCVDMGYKVSAPLAAAVPAVACCGRWAGSNPSWRPRAILLGPSADADGSPCNDGLPNTGCTLQRYGSVGFNERAVIRRIIHGERLTLRMCGHACGVDPRPEL